MLSSRLLPLLLGVPLILGAQTAREKRVVPVDGSSRQSFERQPKVAVLVGVGHYPKRSGLSELRYPAADVDALEAELAKQRYTVIPLKEQEATRGAVLKAIAYVAEVVDRNQGTVVFFFSGHGFAERGQNYLATFEASV